MQVLKKTFSKNNREILLVQSQCLNDCVNSKTILIIGVVHGDEPQGNFLIENYLKTAHSINNRMLFVPCLNPDGMANNTRQNSNLVDINRNFPTKNWELTQRNEFFGGDAPNSEIETSFVVDIIDEFKPDAILTLHAPFKVVNYDGPAKEISEKIAKIINYPVQSDIGYPTPGSFGTYAGIEKNIPVITLELDEEIDVENLIEPINKIIDYLANY